MVILGASALLLVGPGIMGVVIAAVATGVYLVDVRSKLLEVQGKIPLTRLALMKLVPARRPSLSPGWPGPPLAGG